MSLLLNGYVIGLKHSKLQQLLPARVKCTMREKQANNAKLLLPKSQSSYIRLIDLFYSTPLDAQICSSKIKDNSFGVMNILAQRIHNKLATLSTTLAFFASKMQASSTQKTKDSAGRRLGIKVLGGQEVYPNDIIARQRGFKWKSGKNVIVGLDHTIHAKCEGIVSFRECRDRKVSFNYIDVIPQELPNRRHPPPTPYNYHPELFPERAQFNHPEIIKVDKYHVKIKE